MSKSIKSLSVFTLYSFSCWNVKTEKKKKSFALSNFEVILNILPVWDGAAPPIDENFNYFYITVHKNFKLLDKHFTYFIFILIRVNGLQNLKVDATVSVHSITASLLTIKLTFFSFQQSSQLLNTAVLNGRQVSQPMKVFVVSQAGKVGDVTLQSSCHAADESILKVSAFAYL